MRLTFIAAATMALLTTSTSAQQARDCWGTCSGPSFADRVIVRDLQLQAGARNVEDAKNGRFTNSKIQNTAIGTNIQVIAEQDGSGDNDIIINTDNSGDVDADTLIGTLKN